MANITAPSAIKFSNEVLRPLCEAARALKVQLNALSTQWSAGMSAVFATGTDVLVDGRTAEGVTQMTALQITQAVSELLKTSTGQSAVWNDQILQVPCVRLLP